MDVIEIHRIKISISAPFFWGTQERVDTAPKASGCILGGNRAIREEPRKQKPRSCRAQELSRSCARENEWWKWQWIQSSNSRSGEPELRAAADGTIGREVELKGEIVVEWDRRLIRALLAECARHGGPLMSQLGAGTAGKSEAKVCVVEDMDFELLTRR